MLDELAVHFLIPNWVPIHAVEADVSRVEEQSEYLVVVRLGITLLPGGQMDGNSDKTASLHPTLPLHTLPCPMLYCLSRLAVLFQWWNGSVQMGRKEQYIFHKGSGDHPRRIHQSGKGGNPPTWVDAVILGQWSDWERVIGNSNKRLWQWEWGQEDDFENGESLVMWYGGRWW